MMNKGVDNVFLSLDILNIINLKALYKIEFKKIYSF